MHGQLPQRERAMLTVLLLSLLAPLAPAAPGVPAAVPIWSERAAPAIAPVGFPTASAVCFSSRWRHPLRAGDPRDTFASAAAFHATGLYWCIGPGADFFTEAVGRGYPVQGWLASVLPDTLFGNTRERGRIVDQQGELVTGPWMRQWKSWWGCVNSPEFRQTVLEHVRAYLDAGCTSLQMDDPGLNESAVAWGGCWCPYCSAMAAARGVDPPAIQADSTREFYDWLRAEMDRYAGRHVPFSCNALPGTDRFRDDIFDFGLVELNEAWGRAEPMHRLVGQAAARGKGLLFTYVSDDRPRTRVTIALGYALGSPVLVPWDVYLGSGRPRQFGEPADYADLYGFARGAAEWLEGYTTAALVRPETGPASASLPALAVEGASPDLTVVVRAKPGQPDAPVVIHLVDSGTAPSPVTLRFDPAAMFGNRPVTVDWLEPTVYNAAPHTAAEASGDFGPLVHTTRLATGTPSAVTLPVPRPWGLVVVKPATGDDLWPPWVAALPASRHEEQLQIRMTHPSPHTTLRYTLDGTTPTPDSPVWPGQLALDTDTTVTAVAVHEGRVSAPAQVRFRRHLAAATPAAPDSLTGLQLWLRADDLVAGHPDGAAVDHWPARTGPGLEAEAVPLPDHRQSTPPTLAHHALGDRAAVQFAAPTSHLGLDGFANEHLTGAFTILMVARSDDAEFGLAGNGRGGGGGVPRLYLTAGGLTYGASRLSTGAELAMGGLLTGAHDGAETVWVEQDGRLAGTGTGPEWAAGRPFGSGGHLAIPFWSGNRPHPGDLAELVIYDRLLTPAERAAVTLGLARYYHLPGAAMWE